MVIGMMRNVVARIMTRRKRPAALFVVAVRVLDGARICQMTGQGGCLVVQILSCHPGADSRMAAAPARVRLDVKRMRRSYRSS